MTETNDRTRELETLVEDALATELLTADRARLSGYARAAVAALRRHGQVRSVSVDDRAAAIAGRMRSALERCRAVFSNMARENYSRGLFRPRWPVHHEPLRADALALLPVVDAALAGDATEPARVMTKEKFDGSLGYATRLAEALWERHWKTGAPDWSPAPDLLGLITQIDTMTAGLEPPRATIERLEEARSTLEKIVAIKEDTLRERHGALTGHALELREAFDRGYRMAYYRCAQIASNALANLKAKDT